jgi:GAF domain-containing protein
VLREDLVDKAGGVLGDPERLRAVRRLGLGAQADSAFDRIAILVERLVDVPVSVVTVLDADRQFLPGQVGLPQALADSRELPLSHSLSLHVVEDGRLMVVPDVRADDRMRDNPAVKELGAIAFAGVPLTDSEGHVLGTLAVMDREPRTWTRSEVALLVELGEVCSSELRLRIAREIADEERRAAESAHDQLSLLGELTETLSATMDIGEALGRLGRMVAGRLADWCVVALAEPAGTVRHVSAAHHDPAHTGSAERLARLAAEAPREMRALIAAVQRTPLPIREDAADLEALRASVKPAEIVAIAERIGLESYLVAPITAPVGRRTVGVVILVNGVERGPFGEAEERTAIEIGRRAGLAVDNSRLYGRQRHVAEVLQHSMLPELPEIPGIELHARYLPAQIGTAVGGDWYDAFVQPDGSVMLAVGDVSGHDIEAAATMGQVRNLVRGDAYGRDDEPGPLLAQLDRALHGLGMPAAATAVLARLRRGPDGYDLTFANAGHPPPILLRPDGEIEVWWESPEPLLGLLPREIREIRSTHRRRVAPGSTLLLYTDGLVESPAQLIDDGIRRIHAALRDTDALPIDELCTRLLNTAQRRDDDIALLVIRLG